MRQRTLLLSAALLTLAAGLSCLPNPEAPVLQAPGVALLYDANFNSIQMNGDPSGVSWDPTDDRNQMRLVDDYSWAITISLNESDLSDGSIELKFSHDGAWAPDNFGAGGSLGQAELASGPGNIVLPLSLDRGFYTFTFDDETYRYSTDPAPSTGSLAGSLAFDGETPAAGAEIELEVEHPEGDLALWGIDSDGGDFAFTGLADSLYALRVSATGYGSQLLSGIRVENGVAAAQDILLEQVFGAISGTVSFEGVAVAPFPEAIVVALDHSSQLEAGRDTSDVDTGAYIVESLSEGAYDLRFTSPGYGIAVLDSIHIAGDAEVPGQDVTLAAIPSATPDLPWLTAAVDGSIDAGWIAVATDPAGDSGWGPFNDYTGLYVAWDAEKLYLAVTGSFNDPTYGNTVNVYVDSDFGAGTGLTDFSGIQSGTPADHLRKNVDMSGVAGYGAEFAASIWAAQYDAEVSDLTVPTAITPMAEFEMIGDQASTIEFSVPWTSVYPDFGGGVPPFATLGIYCIIGGNGPGDVADDTIPAVGSATSPDAVFSIQVDSDGE